jgi:hypothetical protein
MKAVHRRCCSVALAALLISTALASAGRFENYTRKYKNPPHPVEGVTASYLGGSGTEWLVGGGFLPDGTIVLAGTTLGPEFDITDADRQAVLGSDTDAPDTPVAKKDRKGRTRLPGYKADGGTPFVVWLTPDAQTIKRAIRLPWGAGTATDALVDEKGNIYIAGRAGENLNRAGEVKSISAEDGDKLAFVAQLDPRGKRVRGIRTFADPGKGPKIRMTPKGLLQAVGGWTYRLGPKGKRVSYAETHKVNNWVRAVSPVDMSYSLGYDRNKHTGREPWRQPTLSIGTKAAPIREADMTNYYGWDPKRVGSDKYRLVSDSSFRHLWYDDEGMLWAIGWSDGGNTCLERQPDDLDTKVGKKGLGFSSWGAGVLSLSHIIKIDPKTGKVLNKTLWCGFLKGRKAPSSANVEQINVAPDGSVVIAGASAFGLIQTGDSLFKGKPGGPYVAVLTGDLTSIRFSSSMPAAGVNRIREGTRWDIATDEVKGRFRAIVCGGAVAEKGHYDEPTPAPTRTAVQESFAGGLMDGHFTIIDLGRTEK